MSNVIDIILGKIPNDWQSTTIGAIANVTKLAGYEYTKHIKYNDDGEIIALRALNVRDGYLDLNNLKRIFKNVSDDLPRSKLFQNDILFTYVGANIGQFALVPENDKFHLAPNICRIRTNESYSSKFLYYYFRTNTFRKLIEGYTNGSSQGTLPMGNIRLLTVPKPSFSEQKSIASILTAFDNKIELLQAQNKTLESLAQTVFKEWFGKYQIGDELPQGWRVEKLDKLLELIIDYRGKTPLKLGMDWSDHGIPALSAKSIKNGKIVRREAMNFGSAELYAIWMKDELKKGDILLTSEAPLGEMYYLNDNTKYILSQRLFALRVNNQITSEYLYHYLYSSNGQTLLQARASGSTVEGIRQSELRKIEIIVPEKTILDNASKIFKAAFNKISTNESQIQTLTTTRDALLPKLMSGEIRVEI